MKKYYVIRYGKKEFINANFIGYYTQSTPVIIEESVMKNILSKIKNDDRYNFKLIKLIKI